MTKSYLYFEPQRIAKLQNLNLLARRAVEGFISGLHRSPHKGFSVEFAEHREYTAGDDLRHLDWIAWGRTDRYYIKQYEQETNLHAHILLDVSNSMNYSHSAPISKFAYGCFLAACLSYLMCRQQDMVGLIGFDQKVRFQLGTGSSPSHLDRIFRELENVKPAKSTALAATFHELAQRIAKRGLIVIISDLYDDQDELLKALQHFVYKRHQIIIFHVMDPAELEFPFTKLTSFVDLETNERLRIDPHHVKQTYVRHVNDFISRYRRECADRNIEYVLTRTDTPYDRMLLNYLAKRSKR